MAQHAYITIVYLVCNSIMTLRHEISKFRASTIQDSNVYIAKLDHQRLGTSLGYKPSILSLISIIT